MQPKKQENRGGRRPNSGAKRRRKDLSELMKSRLWRALTKEAKKYGKQPLEVFAERIMDPKTQDSVVIGGWKIVFESIIPKQSHQTVEKHDYKHKVIALAEEIPVEEPEEVNASGTVH